MRARFLPDHPGAVCYVGGVVVRAGESCDATAAEVERIDGLVADGDAAAADFIAAVSEPTPFNPETPPAEASATAEPVKRSPGRPRKVSL